MIGQYYPPDVGGSHRRTFNAIKGLENRGHQIQLVTAVPHYPDGVIPKKYKYKLLITEYEAKHRIFRVWLPSIPHHGFARRLLMYLLFSITSLFALPLTKRPDVIWAASPSVISSIPAKIYSIVKRAPVVQNVDDLWPETAIQLGVLNKRLKSAGEFLARIAYCQGATLTPISPAYSKTLIRKYRIPESKIHVAEVGVDIDAFFNPHSEDESMKEKNRFIIVYSGILGVGYDFEIVIQSAQILEENQEIQFLIRGTGEMENWIRDEVKTRKLTNVLVSNEILERTKLVELLTTADALLLPMKSHGHSDMGIPTKLLEYMACGRPIVCSSAGESARIVKEASCGYVVQPGNAQALSDAISELIKDPSTKKMGLNGRKFVEKNYTIEQIARKLEEAFTQARTL